MSKKSVAKSAVTKVDPTHRIGNAGRYSYGGFLVSGEKNAKLAGTQKYATYDNLLCNCSVAAAGVRYFMNVISKSAWKMEAAYQETPAGVKEAQDKADLVHKIINDMQTPWGRVVRKAVTYKFHGYSVMEWTAKHRLDGVTGFLDIEARPAKTIERWDLAESGEILGVYQRLYSSTKEVFLPRKKFIYMVDDALTDSPEGLGLLRHCVEPAARLARFEELEGYGFETDLRGIPVGRAPLAEIQKLVDDKVITEADAQNIQRPLKEFIENHIKGPKLGMMLDSSPYYQNNDAQTPANTPQWDLELLKGESGSLGDASSAIQRINNEIARILGVEGILLGGQGRGSMALSADKSNNFYMVVDGALKELASTFNKDLIDPLWILNGWDPELKPKFKPDSVQLRDVETITSALKDMATAGAVLAPNDPAINELRDLLGLSHAPEVDEEDLSLLDEEPKKED